MQHLVVKYNGQNYIQINSNVAFTAVNNMCLMWSQMTTKATRWKVLWETTTPCESEIWGFCRQHLDTLATPTIRSIKCKQLTVYAFFWPLLPHPSTDSIETQTWSSLYPYEPFPSNLVQIRPVFLVIMVTDTHTHTHKPTPVKTYSLTFAGIISKQPYHPGSSGRVVTCLLAVWENQGQISLDVDSCLDSHCDIQHTLTV